MSVEFGTHMTVIAGQGRCVVIRHNPPRPYSDVLRDIGRQVATREGELTPRQPYFDGVSTGEPVDLNAANVTGTFRDASGRVRPITGLVGASIASIIGGEPFGNISRFAVALYQEAYKALLAEGKIGKSGFRKGLAGGMEALETLFHAKVQELVQNGFRERYRAHINQSDVRLIRSLGDKKSGAKPQKRRRFDVRQLELIMEDAETAAPSASTVDFTKLPNIKDNPLIRVAGANAGAEVKARQPRLGANKCTRSVRDGGFGCYTDYTGHCRAVPPLHAQTIFGILRTEGALNSEHAFNADDYAAIAKAASAYRRQQSIGGGNICPASAEFVIRVYRLLKLSETHLMQLAVEDLAALYDGYIAAKRDQ
ncbi:MAG: hypothetical protein K2W82_17050 [Candidatus Obscuribacterales bacterium]|nr:hypothetical protein [Candidatus Obscuribacterales bacterium]